MQPCDSSEIQKTLTLALTLNPALNLTITLTLTLTLTLALIPLFRPYSSFKDSNQVLMNPSSLASDPNKYRALSLSSPNLGRKKKHKQQVEVSNFLFSPVWIIVMFEFYLFLYLKREEKPFDFRPPLFCV